MDAISEGSVQEWISGLKLQDKLEPKIVNLWKILELIIGKPTREWTIRLPEIPETEQRAGSVPFVVGVERELAESLRRFYFSRSGRNVGTHHFSGVDDAIEFSLGDEALSAAALSVRSLCRYLGERASRTERDGFR